MNIYYNNNNFIIASQAYFLQDHMMFAKDTKPKEGLGL
jgi:hypothetical protein